MITQDTRPVYVQLIDKLQTMVLSGVYPPGARLPAVRELSGQMQVNPNTVQRALLYLERQGLIYTQRTTGKFITEDEGVIEAARRRLAEGYTEEYLIKMRHIGIDRDSAASYIKKKEDETGGTD